MQQGSTAGYTLLEVLITVAVIVILVSAVPWVNGTLMGITRSARDSERSTDTRAIATHFEQYYRSNPTSAGPSYPTTAQVTNNLGSLISNTDITTPPSANSPKLISATSTANQNPSIGQYIYQPFTPDDSLCTSAPCVRFVIYYRSEAKNEIMTIESRRQQ